MEQKVVYPILNGKIAERGIRKTAIAKKLGISDRAFNNKMTGKSQFTWPEVVRIQNTFFPDISKEELMARLH